MTNGKTISLILLLTIVAGLGIFSIYKYIELGIFATANYSLIILIYILLVLIVIKSNKPKRKGLSKEERTIKNSIESKGSDKNELGEDQEEDSEEDLIASTSSKKYHKITCRLAKQIKKPEHGTQSEFDKKGYSSCGLCFK